MLLSVITPTHDPRFLAATARSMLEQTHTEWEWIIFANGAATVGAVRRALAGVAGASDDHRIRIIGRALASDSDDDATQKHGLRKALSATLISPPVHDRMPSIGRIKRTAFSLGTGTVLVELDHDDVLTLDALTQLADTFADDTVDFAYSNSVDLNFETGASSRYPDSERNGWRYTEEHVHDASIDGPRPISPSVAFAPSAAAFSLIHYAPNHVRAWRRSFYEQIGGHSPAFAICDDHELLIRTYLHGRCHHIDRCLYLYRMGQQNTFASLVKQIEAISYKLYEQNIEPLVLREGQLRGLPCFDLGGAHGCPAGWTPVDRDHITGRVKRFGPDARPEPGICDVLDRRIWRVDDPPDRTQVVADLGQRWPFADSSVLAFRAADILEHLPDVMHTMREIHRCLVPGGWALITVPSTDGRGAFQDPTHVSYWNENSFWYWTRSELARYIRNEQMFMPRWILTSFPSDWHAQHKISYVTAHLQAYKDDMDGIPGVRPT